MSDEDDDLDKEVQRQDYQTLAQGVLSPRHRRLAQLAAEGRTNAECAKELGYSSSRLSILLKNPYILQEIQRLQDRVFEETIQTRLKALGEPALANVEEILKDKSNRVKTSEKLAASQWVIEKLDGKAIQKTDIGENLLSVFLDRLDSKRTARTIEPTPDVNGLDPVIEIKAIEAPKDKPKDELEEWVKDFCGES